MTNIKKLSKRGLALLITLVMCLGLLQLTAFAANEADFEDSEAVEYVDTDTNSGDGTDTMIEEEPDDTQNDASVENGDTEDDADVAEDVVPEDDANIENTETDVDAEPENSVSESVEVDVPSAQVQAFLSAVAALPGTVTEENAEEVFALMQACQDAYDALSAEDMDRADVSAAVVKMAGLMEPVDTLVLIPTTPVAKIGDQEYTILSLAVAAAQPGDTIVFQADIAQSITVSKDVTFDLNGHNWTGHNGTTLTVSGSNNVTVQNGTMTAVEGCKAIEATSGTLVLDDVTFTGITTKLGAVYLSGTMIAKINNCIFTKNVRAINASKATLTLTDCEIVENNNLTWANGAVVYLNSAVTVFNNGKVADNTGVEAKIIEVYGGSFEMNGTTLSSNNSYGVVGTSSAANITMKNVIATNNTGSSSMNSGGSVLNANSISGKTVVLENVTATGNQNTKEHGGAFYFGGSSTSTVINITGCTITGNTALKQGGGIYLNNIGTTTITDTVITGNTANWSLSTNATLFGNAGGGLYVANTTGTVTLSGTTRIYNNSTPADKQISGTNNGGSADIALASTTLSSSTNAKDPNSYTRATLVLNGETSFTDKNGVKYTLTQFDRFLFNTSNGWYYASSKYSWPMGYYTVVEEPVRVYLGTAEQHTSDNAIVTNTLADAVKAAEENGLDTIYVCGNFTVDAANVDALNSGLTFARCGEHGTGHMFTISGNVTLDGAHINGMNVPSNSAMISVPANAHLTITGDTVIENGVNSGNGGAIYVSQGQLTMTGGTITNNTANQGGGIYAIGGKLVSFEGGTVSKNVATGGNGGGGAYIEATSSEFGVNGGRTTFDSNSANQLGGGVFLVNGTNASTHHYIYKATFINNSSYRSMQYFDGGAIYIQSGTTVNMKNVYVSGNTNSDKANNGYTAVAVCPTGELAVYELDGLLSVNNGKTPDIGVVQGGSVPKTSPKVYLASHAPGGGNVSYTLSNGTIVDTSDYQFIEGYFRLYTSASDSAIDAARETAEKDGVIITGNYATQYGSGIMTNGILKIGTETVSLKVVKEWADGAENHDDDQILVYLTKNGEIVDQDFRSDSTVILNKDNNWSYTWTNLGDQFTWGVKEASVGGYASEVKVEKDTQFGVIADKYYIATITNTPGAETHKLSVTKTAYGLDPDASYKFTLKLDNVDDSVFALQLDGTLYPIYNNEITFYLKDGQSAVVEGLPEGFTYEVTEDEGGYHTYVDCVNNDNTTNVNVVNVSKTDIEVEKQWADSDDDAFRPEEIKVDLLANGEVVETTTIRPDDEGKWVSSFTDLPEYDAAGEKIVYTVKEQAVSGYDSKVEGWLITNTLRRGSLTINKAVVGGSADASTEKEYTFIVSGPNEYYEEVTIHGEGSVTISGLLPGIYTVTEDEVSAEINGYSLSVAVDNGEVEVVGGETAEVTFTNTYTPDNPPSKPVYTSLTVNKVWEDEGNEDIRPDSIQVQLYRNGNAYGNLVTLDETNGWSYHWTNLTAGVNWTAEEVNVPDGYTSSTTQAGTVVTITNTYVPEEDDEDKDEDEEEDLDDPDVPLTDLPDDPEEEELDDPDVPLGDRPDDIDEDEELDDPDVPLTDLPEIPEEEDIPEEDVPQSEVSEEVPEVEIFEEDVPLAEVPKTGDNFSNLWYALTAAAAAGLMALKAVERKKREED